ncbi:MAG: hypothetical protein KDB22_23850 [Planctomycetales bacterium]|nr:hypothetical protein [Planctomycetales bacterium]
MTNSIHALAVAVCLLGSVAQAQPSVRTTAEIGPFGSGGESHATGNFATGNVYSDSNVVRSMAIGADEWGTAFSTSHATQTPWGVQSSSFGMNFGSLPATAGRPTNEAPAWTIDFPNSRPLPRRGLSERIDLPRNGAIDYPTATLGLPIDQYMPNPRPVCPTFACRQY